MTHANFMNGVSHAEKVYWLALYQLEQADNTP